MKSKPLYCDSCKKECRKNSRPVFGYILCNYCNISLINYGNLLLANGKKLFIVKELEDE